MMSAGANTVFFFVVLTFFIQGLHGQTLSFQQRANVNENAGSIDVCVSATEAGDSQMNTTVNISVDAGRTQAGPEDFSPQDAVLFFTAQEILNGDLKCFTVNITDDQTVEDAEAIAYQIVATDPPGLTIANNELFTVDDNDVAIVSMAREEQFVSEENGAMTMVCLFFVGPSGGLERTLSISAQIVPGTATAPEDYIGTILEAIFQPGTLPGNESCGTIEVDSNNALDGDRQFQVVLVPSATLGATAVEPLTTNVTIQDNENATLTLDDLPEFVTEGNSVSICVRIDQFPQVVVDVSVGIVTQDGVIGQASSDDFDVTLLELTFSVNNRLTCGSIMIISDSLIEGNETLLVSILSSSLDLVLGPSVSSNISDADRANVSFVQSEFVATEGVEGEILVCAELLDLPVNGSATPITVMISNVNLGATRCNPMNYARDPEDFMVNETITFPTGVSPPPQCLNVVIIDDTAAETNETIQLMISSANPSNVEPNEITTVEVTIVDNDNVIFNLQMAATAPENETDFEQFVNISSSLATILERNINVTIISLSGTAIAPSDYDSTPILVTFDCTESITLQPPTMRGFTITIIDDFVLEGPETFDVVISDISPSDNVDPSVLPSTQLTVTIEDDEFIVGFNETELFLLESANIVNLEFAISDGTIRRPTEFMITSSDTNQLDLQVITPLVTLSPDATSAIVSIRIINDAAAEPDEMFQLTINATSDMSAIIVNNTVNITIDSDDMSEVFLNVTSNITEADTVSACVGVRGSLLGTNLTVELQAVDGTAVLGSDYMITGSGLTFQIPALSTEICQDIIRALDDDVFEDFENLEVNITETSFEDVTIGMPRSQNITIINTDELTITIRPERLSIEENGGMTNITASSVVGGGQDIPLTFQLNFTSSSATLNSDFTISGDVLLFPVSIFNQVQIIEVNATDDEILEGEENIVFSLFPSDVLDLPGLNINIVNDTISIVDDEVIRIEFVDSFFNFTEGDTNVEVCIRPESIPAAGYSVPIVVNISIVSSSIDSMNCSGSGMASDDDFDARSETTFTFPPNSTDPQCLSLNITDDDLTEGTEMFSLDIGVISPPLIATSGSQAIVNINDTDTITVGIVQFMPSGVPEDVGNVLTCIIVNDGQLCSATVANITVDPPSPSNIATADLDFIDGPFSADLPVGSTVNTTACFNVTIIDDMVVDSTSSNLEIIGLSLNADSNPLITAASMSLDMVSIVINDNDAAVRFANDSLVLHEGQNVTICVEIFSGQLLDQASVELQMVANPSAGANAGGSDFVLSTSVLSFGPETSINCTTLSISEDISKEANESLYFRIFEDESTIVGTNDTLNITIVSKNVAVVSFVGDAVITVSESVGTVVLCTELSGTNLDIDLTIPYETIDGTAENPTDYRLPMNQAFMFFQGSMIGTQLCTSITIVDNDQFENTQNFTVRLVDPENPFCTIGNLSEVVIVIEDNEVVTLTFSTAELTINEGVTDDTIQLLLDIPTEGIEENLTGVIVPNLISAESDDFEFASTFFTFLPNTLPPRTSINLTLTAIADLLLEQDEETFILSFDTLGTNVTIGAIPNVTITIINLDSGTVRFDQSLAGIAIPENTGIVTIDIELVLTNSVVLEDPLDVTLDYESGTALVNVDFVPINLTLTFMPGGSQVLQASIRYIQDELFEMDAETFSVNLTDVSFSTVNISNSPISIGIQDNDVATFRVTPVRTSVVENEDNVTICAVLDGPDNGTAVNITVAFELVNNTAVRGADFEAIPGVDSFLFPAGSSFNDTVCVDVDILEDLLFEGNELFMLLALEPNRGVVDPSTANITIIDNELRVDFLNDSLEIITPETAVTFPICFEVVEGNPTFDHDISLMPDPQSTAIEGSDYILLGNPLIINSTTISGCINIQIVDDNFFENNDFVSFTVTTTSPGLQVDGSLNLTIVNVEFPVFGFRNTKYVVNESSNTEVCVRTLPSGANISSELPVNVALTIRNKTASESIDFSFPSGLLLTFGHDSSVECAPVMIVRDAEDELTESFLVSFDSFGISDEVEVVIYDSNVCPNVDEGSICEDSIFLRVCNSIRAMNPGAVPRSCEVVREEYTDINHEAMMNDDPTIPAPVTVP